MTESADPAGGSIEVIDHGESGLYDRGHDELGNPGSALDSKRFLSRIEENDLDFSPIVGVDGPGSIQEADPVTEGQSAPRTDLTFESFGKGQLEAGRNEGALAGLDFYWFGERGEKIESARPVRHVLRQGKSFKMREAVNLNVYGFRHRT